MFHDILTVAKKELKACISDKLILAQIILLPFIVVFGYSLLMSVMNADKKTDMNTAFSAYCVNAPEYFEEGLRQLGAESVSADKINTIKNDISNKDKDILIVFPDNFKIAEVGSQSVSEVAIWYNSESTESLAAFNTVNAFLNSVQPRVFTVNSSESVKYDLGDENAVFRTMLGTVLPIMVLMMVFMVCMNLAAESISGDKERGFLNTMLITPVARSSIAAGKSLCIFIAAIVGGLSAFAGMALSLPKLAEAMGIEGGISYTIGEYLILFAVTLTAVFILTGVLLILSALAKDVKQATTLAPIIMVILMIAGMLGMNESFTASVEKLGNIKFIIPAWNSMLVMQNIIELDYTPVSVVITCISNLIYTVIAIIIVGRLFENERIVNAA